MIPWFRRGTTLLATMATIAGALVWQVESASAADTIVVTTTADSGVGSLRAAITEANSDTDTDTIAFAIPGAGPHTIQLASDLTNIVRPAILDATTQPGWSSWKPQVVIDGQGKWTALIAKRTVTIRGFAIYGAKGPGAIALGESDSVVQGNFIGVDATGTIAKGNLGSGIVTITSALGQAQSQLIGGPDPGDGNVIAASKVSGISLLAGSDNTIQGNYVGTDVTGKRSGFGNHLIGIQLYLGGSGARILDNVVSGNLVGIESAVTDAVIQGNLIGTDVTGLAPLGNTGQGVDAGTRGTLIGGPGPGEGNVIGANNTGVLMRLYDGTVTVQGNLIGVGSDKTTPLGNNRGVHFFDGNNDDKIGGTEPGEPNVIAHNRSGAIRVEFRNTGNSFTQNSIYGNGLTPIDLGKQHETSPGPTANDDRDPDVGGNRLQNYPKQPVVVSSDASSTVVSSDFNSTPGRRFVIEYFAGRNPSSQDAGPCNWAGKRFLGQKEVTTDADGNAQVTTTVGGTYAKEMLTSTATDQTTHDTSEWSPCTETSSTASPDSHSTRIHTEIQRLDESGNSLGQGETIFVPLDTNVRDTTTLDGVNIAGAGGTVTYELFSDGACSDRIAGPMEKSVTDGVVPPSDPVQLTDYGSFEWVVTYSGDSLNDPVKSSCGDETVIVPRTFPPDPKPTGVSTSLESGTEHGVHLTVPTGSIVHDTVTLSGDNAAEASGTVTYKVFTDEDCQELYTPAGERNVVGGVVGDSDPVTFPNPGTYYWVADYSGDLDPDGVGQNKPSVSSCGSETVRVVEEEPTTPDPVETTTSTTLWSGEVSGTDLSLPTGSEVFDTAQIGGHTDDASGTMTYEVYRDAECTDLMTTAGVQPVGFGLAPDSDVVRFDEPGKYFWVARYSGDEGTAGTPGTPGNLPSVSDCGDETVTIHDVADVDITKTASPTELFIGENVTYKLVASNVGPQPAHDVIVSDQVPTGMSFVSASAGCVRLAGSVLCDAGTLAPDESVTFTVVTTAAAAGTITNAASVATSTFDADLANNRDDASVVVRSAQLLCKGTALSLPLGLAFGVTNAAETPCASAKKAVLTVAERIGLPGPRLGTVNNTVKAKALLSHTVRGTRSAAADAQVASAQITIPSLPLKLEVTGARSEAKSEIASCSDPATLTSSSKIASLKLNGLTIPVLENKPIKVQLIVGTLYINQRVVQGNTVTRRAVFLDLPGTALDVVIAESKAGAHCDPIP